MENRFLAILLIFCATLCGCGGDAALSPAHRGIYHWKTVYNPSKWELDWMRQHRVDRLYIKLFDIEPGAKNGYDDWTMVPVATTQFRQKLPDNLDVVPVVYITVDAIRALENDFERDADLRFANMIVKRIDDMMGENYGGTVREIQLDCDWTKQTQCSYFSLCLNIRRLLHERGITLSGTVRLHQLPLLAFPPEKNYSVRYVGSTPVCDSVPFDRSLLMCYNTGQLQNRKTRNSILDFNDAMPYLRQYPKDSLLYCDVAWPVYGWGVEFDQSGEFVRLVNSHDLTTDVVPSLRVEWGETEEIKKMQNTLPKLDKDHTTILFHLDSLNLSKYSHDEIETIYSR